MARRGVSGVPVELSRPGVVGLLLTVADILIVAYFIYRLIVLIRGTRAVVLLRGLAVLLVLWLLSGWLRLETTYWLLDRGFLALAVALPVVFQPELRRALEQMGRGGFLPRGFLAMEAGAVKAVVEAVVKAAMTLSRRRAGAVIVLERETRLGDIAETGVRLDALVSAEVLVNIFSPQTPLHDGAVIVRGDRVLAAACYLPLAEARPLEPELGSRHRAAVGITEHSDAVAVIVSEETGALSLAHAGKLVRHLDEATLRETLQGLLVPPDHGRLLGRLTAR